MTGNQAYEYYRAFATAHATYTSDDPESKRSIPEAQPWGVQDFRFYGSEALAGFLNFVIEREKAK